ncbi:MAG: Asp-tRNA(Asn)/Glu-tRNA(Gln) amidotransferase subunit GatA [Chloroflexota bacterium]
MEHPYLTVSQARDLLDRRQVSSVELTRDALLRVEREDSEIHAFLLLASDLAMDQARAADKRLRRGDASALLGIPMAVKDILSVEGVRTTCGSAILRDYVPQYSATVVRRLVEQGCVMLGKTNMDEFAMGSSTENSAFGPTRNPWNLDTVPGGSSGGSAAAVASGMAVYALGTDTGGSIRQPASFTGTVGLKPTYGRVSRYGLVAFASSLDQIGPFARSVHDCAVVLEAIAGHDLRDSTSVDIPVPHYTAHMGGDIRGMRVGIPREYFLDGMQPDVRSALETAIRQFQELGATLVDVSLPHTEYALSTYYIISPAEAMANLARYDGVRYGLTCPGHDVFDTFARTREAGFGAEVKRRILLGAYALSAGYYDAYYLKAQQVRTLVRRDFDRAFEQADVLLTPTSPTTAFRLGEKVDDPLQMYLSDVYTVPINMAGICGLSLPCGFAGGLPIGMQLVGPAFAEERILKAGDAFQRITDHHLQRPESRRIPA